MIIYLIIILIVILFYLFYRNCKYKKFLKELNTEHFSMNKSNTIKKINFKKDIPSNPNIVFCDIYGNLNIIKDNKFTLINSKGEILKNNININDIYKIPYSINIKCGTKYGKYLIILTKENIIYEYDLIDKTLTKEYINSYFKNVKIEVDNMLFMEKYFYLFNKNNITIYDKNNNKIINTIKINKLFKNAPTKFSAIFLNNNILYKNISHGSPCFFRNKDLFIYDIKRKDTYYTNIDNGLISNTDYNIIKYSRTKAKYTINNNNYYRIICVGGGLESGGYGGCVFNDYKLKKNEKLELCVGGSGERIPLKDKIINTNKLPYTCSSAGSGGSFVYKNNKLLICAGGGGGWSSEIIKSPNICNSSFSKQKNNKLVIPIKKMVLITKNTDYHKINNIKQKLIIKDFKISCYNYNIVDYDVIEKPQNSNKTNIFETYYNNSNESSSITFEFANVLSDYDFTIDCNVLSTNNDKNDCDLHIYDEQNRVLIIKDYIEKINNTKINSNIIINLFVKYPKTLNNSNISSGNKLSNKYDNLFDNMGPDSLDYPNIKLDGGIGGGGYSYINKSKHIVSCGGGGGYIGGDHTSLSNEDNDFLRKYINIDYVCGVGGLSFIKDTKFSNNNFINDYNNDDGFIIIIEIKELQQLGKLDNNSYLDKENKLINPFDYLTKNPSDYFIRNKTKNNNFDINVPSINSNVSFDKENSKINTINNTINIGVNYFKIKIYPDKYDKIKIFIKCKYDIDIILMYFSTKTLMRSLIKDDNIKNDNILSLNHGMVNPSLLNIFTFLEKLLQQNIYSFNGSLKTKTKTKNKKIFDNKDFVYNKSKILTLDLRKIRNIDYLYILVNSSKKSDIKINIIQYNSNNKLLKDNEMESQLKLL